MRIDEQGKRIFVRQSGLNDMIICAERSRLRQVLPQLVSASDATIMGTAVHYGIEQILGGSTHVEGRDAALEHFEVLRKEPFKQTNIDPDSYHDSIGSMMDAFVGGILPEVELGGAIEYRFMAPLNVRVDGYEVILEGTMDYVSPSGVIWDWKTATRAYNGKDKQSTSIQASVYAHAAHYNGKSPMPTDFRYGVMVRQASPKAQIVYLRRDSSHVAWLRDTVESAVRYALRMGLDYPWLRNDTGALCSDKWCSHWSVCKGARLSPEELAIPAVPVSVSVDRGTIGVVNSQPQTTDQERADSNG